MKDRLFAIVCLVFGSLLLMWIVFFLDPERQLAWYTYGILPRDWVGLRGIICSPFLHGNLEHLLANTLPFLVLGILLALHGTAVFVKATCTIVFISGILVWLVGANTYHIGASGVVFGYLGYLMTYGWYVKRFIPFVISIVVFILYGGALVGVLPSDPHISWYSHLFGFIAGVQAARDRSNEVKKELAHEL